MIDRTIDPVLTGECDLFGQPITEPKPVHHHGHPARPGTGPKGETCGTCQHRVHVKSGRHTYQKCRLIRANWSHGPGTDIKKKDAACAFWEGKAPSVDTSLT